MRLIAWLLTEILRKTGGIQAFLIRHISRAKVSLYRVIEYSTGFYFCYAIERIKFGSANSPITNSFAHIIL